MRMNGTAETRRSLVGVVGFGLKRTALGSKVLTYESIKD